MQFASVYFAGWIPSLTSKDVSKVTERLPMIFLKGFVFSRLCRMSSLKDGVRAVAPGFQNVWSNSTDGLRLKTEKDVAIKSIHPLLSNRRLVLISVC